jgi:Winged helix-turn helix
MRGRQPLPYCLSEVDRQYLHELLADGQLMQRVANRAQTLLALDRGERIVEIVHWLGWSRMGRWDLWQRYQAWGVAAIFDAERPGRPPVFSPAAVRSDRAHRVH